MIVVYADGGGLGHLTRVQSLRHTLGLREDVTVLTSSHHARDGRVAEGLRIVPIPDRRGDIVARRAWLRRTIEALAPSLVVVDAFPAGLGGEIDATAVEGSVRVVHVARLLRWEPYQRVLPSNSLRFRQTLVLEPLHAEHARFLAETSDEVVPFELTDPDPPPDVATRWPAIGPPDDGRPRWLIAHTGPAAEVVELLGYARDQAEVEGVAAVFVVATPPDAAPPAQHDVVLLDRYPVWPLFATADRIVTAAGFNAMRQTAPHRSRHRFLAMPRRYDDQLERARRAHLARASAP